MSFRIPSLYGYWVPSPYIFQTSDGQSWSVFKSGFGSGQFFIQRDDGMVFTLSYRVVLFGLGPAPAGYEYSLKRFPSASSRIYTPPPGSPMQLLYPIDFYGTFKIYSGSANIGSNGDYNMPDENASGISGGIIMFNHAGVTRFSGDVGGTTNIGISVGEGFVYDIIDASGQSYNPDSFFDTLSRAF